MAAPRPINFRLPAHQHRRLVQQAGPETPNLFARELVLRALDEDALARRLESHLEQSAVPVAELRRDLSVAFQALLVLLGKATPEQARDWAEQHLG
jgi:hypothetical protein